MKLLSDGNSYVNIADNDNHHHYYAVKLLHDENVEVF